MPDRPSEPIFNLRAVVQQTGIKPDTLRAWERRYGLPTPQRSSGGHRLYSRRDIDTIMWLIARQREGMSISRAIEMWEQYETAGQDPVLVVSPTARPAAPAPQPVGGTVSDLREQWIDACLGYDEQRAEQLLNHAFALYTPETVVVEILQRAMSQIGQGWYEGNVTVQQEHFCSSLIARRLEALIMAAPPPTRPGRILAACPPEENHTIGLLLLTYLLRRRGWDVVYLGANAPIEQMETTITATRPQLVVMTAQLLHTAATLRDTSRLLQQEEVTLGYGGRIFHASPALQQRIAGYYLGEDIQAAPHMIETLIAAPLPAPTLEEIPDTYHRALQHFQERQGLIDAHVMQAIFSTSPAPNHLTLANRELSQHITAALTLGDMTFLDANIDWLAGLLRNYGMPTETLHDYLTIYRQGVTEHLDERAQPIIGWFDKLLNNPTAN